MSGILFIVSGPSGVGKTVLCNKILEIFQQELRYSISATTRLPRAQEKDGQEYFFYSRQQFEEGVTNNLFAEWAMVHDNYYGTPKSFLDENLDRGQHILLNIDVQGALKIKKCYSNAVLIFILPPSLEVLKKRLKNRNIDSEEALKKRMRNARKELEFQREYTHSLVNDSLDDAVVQLANLVKQRISEN